MDSTKSFGGIKETLFHKTIEITIHGIYVTAVLPSVASSGLMAFVASYLMFFIGWRSSFGGLPDVRAHSLLL